MGVELLAEVGGAGDDVLPVDGAGEGLVFHLAADRAGVEIGDVLGGLDQGGGGDKAGELVAGEEGLLHRSDAGDAGVLGVAEDAAAQLFGPSALFQDLVADEGMLLRGGVALVVEVVEQAGEAVLVFFAGLELCRIGAHAGLDGEGVFAQTLRLGVLT